MLSFTGEQHMALYPTNIVAAAIAAALIAFPGCAFAADGGKNGALLTQVLMASAQGECPTGLMAPTLVGACRQQMPGMGQRLLSLGAIQSAEFLGTQQTQMGPAEVYLVTFQSGKMTWMINTQPDGKILVLWSGS
jgi:hypothetical protein